MTHRILLAVAGTSVGTVTEALWALAVDRKLAIHEIRLLVTQQAHNTIAERLTAALAAMRADFPRAKFPDRAEWRVVANEAGEPLDDIRNSRENEVLADWMLREVQEACADPGSEVHASLAGGRKTMSFYLGAAMQVCARRQDRLYHVLVPSEFEVPEFHYPKPAKARDAMISPRNREPFDARQVRVDLAEVPFVRLAPLLSGEEVEKLSFRQLISRTDDRLSEEYAQVEVIPHDFKTGEAVIRYQRGGNVLAEVRYRTAATQEFLYLVWLLSRAKNSLGAFAPLSQEQFPTLIDDFIRCSRETLGLPQEDAAGRPPEAIGWLITIRNEYEQALHPETNHKFALKQADTTDPCTILADQWYKAIKSFPSRINKRIKEAFAESAKDRSPHRYLVRTHNGPHLTIPPESIVLRSGRKTRKATR